MTSVPCTRSLATLIRERGAWHRVVLVAGVPMHGLNALLQRQVRHELLQAGRRVPVTEQVRGQSDTVLPRAPGVDAAQHEVAPAGVLDNLCARVLFGLPPANQLHLVRLIVL